MIARVAEGFCGRVIAPGHCVVPRPARLSRRAGRRHPGCLHHRLVFAGPPGPHRQGGHGADPFGGGRRRRGGDPDCPPRRPIVIATAGTKEKQAYLRQMGVQHVFDSRSLDFFNHVMAATKGRGVDIVLNSLTGRFIAQSLKCLAPFGRFIELGKADIYRNSKLNMERLGENIAFFVVDVDRLAAQKPDWHRQVFTELIELFERGELEPQEITEFPISKLAEALKFMTRSNYRGKIVMNMENGTVRALPPRSAAFRGDRSYLITGGASGVRAGDRPLDGGGRRRHLVLLSRSGCKLGSDRAAVEAMKEQGVRVMLPHADVADEAAVSRLIERIRSEMPPLAGVIHGAAVMDDALLPNMDMARFAPRLRPKGQGRGTCTGRRGGRLKLDFFVLLSSISSVLGFYGQVNYVAANYFQDALAQYRRQRGLPAQRSTSASWGKYAGMSSSDKGASMTSSHCLKATACW